MLATIGGRTYDLTKERAPLIPGAGSAFGRGVEAGGARFGESEPYIPARGLREAGVSTLSGTPEQQAMAALEASAPRLAQLRAQAQIAEAERAIKDPYDLEGIRQREVAEQEGARETERRVLAETARIDAEADSKVKALMARGEWILQAQGDPSKGIPPDPAGARARIDAILEEAKQEKERVTLWMTQVGTNRSLRQYTAPRG